MTIHQTPLKIGVAGAGVMGRNHARVLAELRDVELTTVFDPDAVTDRRLVPSDDGNDKPRTNA